MNHYIVYCSPGGSTRHAANVIAERLVQLGNSADMFDIGQKSELTEVNRLILDAKQAFCLWVGSPVYVDHAVPPIEYFISNLPTQRNSHAVPFVTWGAVSSGTALHEMGKNLVDKGFLLLGAAKVLAVHSSMWQAIHPLGEGHPDSGDDSILRSLVEEIISKLSSASAPSLLALDQLNYQPTEVQHEAKEKSIAVAKSLYPSLKPDEDKCTQCAECAEKCPADAITLDPYPQVGDDCFLCLRCVRECPEKAIPWDTSLMEERIRSLAALSKESRTTKIFVR